MKKVTTIRLIIFLVVLVLIYSAVEFFSTTGRSSSFRQELVSIDATEVTELRITKEDQTLFLVKQDTTWQVYTKEERKFTAMEDRIQSALSSLQTISPSRIATRNPGKWLEFQVDSTGTRVEIFQGDDKALDIVLGRFGMQGQQQFHTYVRLFDEDDVYVAEDFMSFSLPTGVESYRNQKLTQLVADSVQRLQFNYPGDSSFVLQKTLENKWAVGAELADSTGVVAYIGSLGRLSSSKFSDLESLGSTAAYALTIEVNGQDDIQLEAHPETDSTFYITSTSNKEAIFGDETLFDRIFKSPSEFLPETPDPE